MNVEKLINHKGRHQPISINDLIMPLFVREGITEKNPVNSMPGVFQYTIKECADKAKELEDLGINSVILFGVPNKKDENGSEAYNPNGIVQQATRAIKEKTKNLIIITDCCLCQYTNHGECGVVCENTIDNDDTRELLGRIAVSQAQAGSDMIAPSGMITHMVKTIRRALDESNKKETKIMSYSAKYASNFYGPFREAGGSTYSGDGRETQLKIHDADSCVQEVCEDIQEGADITMVKPALCYLDIIAKVRQETDVALAAYNVSGEYSCVKYAAQNGAINEEKVIQEILCSIKRAGADLIITYFAEELSRKHQKVS